MRDQHTDVQDLYLIRSSLNTLRTGLMHSNTAMHNFSEAVRICSEILVSIDAVIEEQKNVRDRRAEYKRQIKRVISGLRYWYKPNSSAYEVADSVDELVDKIETGTE